MKRLICWFRQWASVSRTLRAGWPLEMRTTGHVYDSKTFRCDTCGDDFWAKTENYTVKR